MTRSPSDPGPTPVGTPKPESFATDYNGDCVVGRSDVGRGSSGAAALGEIPERNRSRQSASNHRGHRRGANFEAHAAFRDYLTKCYVIPKPSNQAKPLPIKHPDAFPRLAIRRIQGIGSRSVLETPPHGDRIIENERGQARPLLMRSLI